MLDVKEEMVIKPIIGITASTELDGKEYKVHQDHVRAVIHAGGIPILLPYLTEEINVIRVMQQIDGLYATGGYDIDPTLFNEEPHPDLGAIIPERDAFEVMLMTKMLEEKKPILGVCRGCQILNIVVGGDMYQDIYEQTSQPLLQHDQKAPAGHGSHFVDVVKDSLLYRLTHRERLKVNSRHHQANRFVPDSFLISAQSSDGMIEAIESKKHDFVLGVQWHPENMLAVKDVASIQIFKGFIAACEERSSCV